MPTSSEVSTRLTADNSQFRSVMNETERVAERAGKSIFKKLDLRFAMASVATAIGININNIAENIARTWSGVTKQVEEDMKRMEAAGERLFEANKAFNDRYLSDNQRLTRARHELQSLEESLRTHVPGIEADKARQDEISVQILQKKLELEKLEAVVVSAREKSSREFWEARDRENKVYADFLAKQAVLSAAAADNENKRLSDLGFAEDLEWVKEQDRIAASKKLKEKALVELHQLEMANEAEAARVEQARIDEKFKSLVDQWTGFQVLITSSGRSDRELSDRELERKAANIQQEIFRSNLGRIDRIGVGNPSGAGGFDVINQQNLSGVQAEQNLRRNVRRTAATQGENAAFNQFSGLTEQRFADILKGATDQSQLLTAINKLTDKFDQPLKTIDVSQASPFG